MRKRQSQEDKPVWDGNRTGAGKGPAVSKSFLTVGPTLHYSHQHVQICWILGLFAFGICCLLWSKITTGFFWAHQTGTLLADATWRLEHFSITGISILEYPWQILVLGILMGIFCAVPILIAQLMSFNYSLPFIGAVLILANLPGIALSLAISCFGVACRPLRFRSRIIAIALCMAPQLIYWGAFGGARGQGPVVWGISFAPWVCAWLVGMVIAGAVLGIGHITRYRPGLVWTSTALGLVLAITVFESKIGFDELAFQLYVNKNSPDEAMEFHDHSITALLDARIKDPSMREYLAKFFYPTEPIPLREELKRELQVQLSYDRWPAWIKGHLPPALEYQAKRRWLNSQYNLFVTPPKAWWMPDFLYEQLQKRHAASKRMAIALYYRGLLSEKSPDVVALGKTEVLQFYTDYPFDRSRTTWLELYERFPESLESLEARWRLAKQWAGLTQFDRALDTLLEARQQIQDRLDDPNESTIELGTILQQFHPPADSVMTDVKLMDLLSRIDRLARLIGPENRDDDPQANSNLARFVMLNPYASDYSGRLKSLLQQIGEQDRLRDNVLLAEAKLEADLQKKAADLLLLHEQYMGADGGMEALYELGLVKIHRYQIESDPSQKNELLKNARDTLTEFLRLYPDSIFAARVQHNLAGLPDGE
ncbi:tol-pal system YbgF family protein [Planctomycetota bacterium]